MAYYDRKIRQHLDKGSAFTSFKRLRSIFIRSPADDHPFASLVLRRQKPSVLRANPLPKDDTFVHQYYNTSLNLLLNELS